MLVRHVSLVVLLAMLANLFAASPGNVPQVTHAAVPELPSGPPEDTPTSNFAPPSDESEDIGLSYIEPNPEIALTPIGRYTTNIQQGAEIVAHDPGTQRLFVINNNEDTLSLDILDISGLPATPPTLVRSVNMLLLHRTFGGIPNSVAVKNGIVAVALENRNSRVFTGAVAFLNPDGNALAFAEVPALPDMLTFTPDGTKVVVACEGEPLDDYSQDPEGEVAIINVPTTFPSPPPVLTATTINFRDFNVGGPRNDELDANVRVFGPGATVAQDIEPEYVAISADSRTAYVTLQENNAVAIIDIPTATITRIVGLGFKDHSGVKLHPFPTLPSIGTTAAGETIRLGGFSGLFFEGIDPTTGNYEFITHPDRGPNAEPVDVTVGGQTVRGARPFALPNFQTRAVRFELAPTSGIITITGQILFRRSDGTPISGRPNLFDRTRQSTLAYQDEVPIDLRGGLLDPDAFGADLEGIVVAPNGDLWLVDEYRPSIYHFSPDGVLQNRFVPLGSNSTGRVTGVEALPAVYAQRRVNRGFEAVALEGRKLYAFIQSPIDNPDTTNDANSRASHNVRILEFDVISNTTTAEYLYELQGGASDKIGDAVALGNGEFYVMERDDEIGINAQKKVFRISLAGATNLSTLPPNIGGPGGTLESLDTGALVTAGIRPVSKELVIDLISVGYDFADKPEGLAFNPAGRQLFVLNDNDFGLEGGVNLSTGRLTPNPNPTPIVLGQIDITRLRNRLDASNSDGRINIRNWPVKGMYLPDAIATFTVNGDTYLITANEGDARAYEGFSEEARVRDLRLDPAAFPNTLVLTSNAALGRLLVTNTRGDTDGDGDYDELYAFGTRSFSIWNSAGRQVYDSGDQFEYITAATYPEYFNANFNTSSAQDRFIFDDRSDDKGPEPETVTTGVIDGQTYAFVALERTGGIMVYDITNPRSPQFVQYVNTANFEGGLRTNPPTAGDVSPEGLTFVPAADSPTGKPLVIAAYELSGSTVVFEVNDPNGAGSLSLLHNNDGESSLLPIEYSVEPSPQFPAITDTVQLDVGSAAAFESVMDREIADARNRRQAVVSLYSGDAFLASATLQCSLDDPQGRFFDAIAQRQMPFDVHVLGNHEFDFSPDLLERFIRQFAINGVLVQPFVAANLDFSGEPGFADLLAEDGIYLGYTTNGRVIARSALVTDKRTGQRFGVVGVITEQLPNISTPRAVTVTANITATAQVVQTEIDRLRNEYNVQKIIMGSQLQAAVNDIELVEQLRGVDIAVAGGGDELLVNSSLTTTLQLLPGETQDIGGEYPIPVQDAEGRTVYVVTTAGNYKYLGRLDVEFNDAGDITRVISETSYPRPIIPVSSVATTLGLTNTVTPDPAIVTSVQQPLEACLAARSVPILGSEVLLDVSRSAVRTRETNAGNLITDSFLDTYRRLAATNGLPAISPENPVIAIQNGGGIRQNAGNVLPTSGVVPGTISRLDTQNVLAFLTNLVSVVEEVTPEDLKAIFERSVGRIDPGATPLPTPGEFLQIAGITVTYELANTPMEIEEDGTVLVPGSRVVELTLSDGTPIVRNGAVVAGAPNVTIVTNSFTAGGGDNYPWLRDNPNKTQLLGTDGIALTYEEAWVEYMLRFPRKTIEGLNLPTLPATDLRYRPGGQGRIRFILPPRTPGSITLEVDERNLEIGGSTVLTATLIDTAGETLQGADVTFATTLGSITDPATLPTDANGVAVATFQAGTTPGLAVVSVRIGTVVTRTTVLVRRTGTTNALVGGPLVVTVPQTPTGTLSGTVLMQAGSRFAGSTLEFAATTATLRNLGAVIFQEVISPTAAVAVPGTTGITPTEAIVGSFFVRLVDRNGNLVSGSISPNSITLRLVFTPPPGQGNFARTIQVLRYDPGTQQWVSSGINQVGPVVGPDNQGKFTATYELSHFSEFVVTLNRFAQLYLPFVNK